MEDILDQVRKAESEALSPSNKEFYKKCGDELERLRKLVAHQGKEPDAWVFELANARYPETGEYTNWSNPQLSFTRPNVPLQSIRNIKPLYS